LPLLPSLPACLPPFLPSTGTAPTATALTTSPPWPSLSPTSPSPANVRPSLPPSLRLPSPPPSYIPFICSSFTLLLIRPPSLPPSLHLPHLVSAPHLQEMVCPDCVRLVIRARYRQARLLSIYPFYFNFFFLFSPCFSFLSLDSTVRYVFSCLFPFLFLLPPLCSLFPASSFVFLVLFLHASYHPFSLHFPPFPSALILPSLPPSFPPFLTNTGAQARLLLRD